MYFGDHRPRVRLGFVMAALVVSAVAEAAPTIDRMTLGLSPYKDIAWGGRFALPPSSYNSWFFMSDGTSGERGGGGHRDIRASASSVEVDGASFRYTLDHPVGDEIYWCYSGGDYSMAGALTSTAPLVLTTSMGSKVATITGYARVKWNEPYYDKLQPHYRFFTAPVKSFVPFTFTITIDTAPDPVTGVWGPTSWSPHTFERPFYYFSVGEIDFKSYFYPVPG